MADQKLCFYFMQGEQGESAEEPNAFPVMTSGATVTLKQLLASFPLARSASHHFRVRVGDDRFGYSWQDIRDPNASIPLVRGVIHAKVLRLDQPPQRPCRLRRRPLLASTILRQSSSTLTSESPRLPHANPHIRRQSSDGSLGRHSPFHGNNATPQKGIVEGLQSSKDATGIGEARDGGSFGPKRGNLQRVPGTPPAPTRSNSSHPPDAAIPANQSSPGRGSHSNVTSARVNGPTPDSSAVPADSTTFFDTSVPAPGPPPPVPVPLPPRSGDDLDSFLYSPPSHGRVTTSIKMPSASAAPRAQPSKSTSRVPASTAATSNRNGLFDLQRPSASASSAPNSRAATPAQLDIDDDTVPMSAGVRPGFGPAEGVTSQEDLFFMQEAPTKDILEAQEDVALEIIRTKLGPKLKEWASDPQSGKLRNVRTLLSTMDTVLWEGCTWKAIFLGDLMAPERVKFHYRKAMLLLHPDKNVNGTIEQRFVAERVFTCVNEAYTLFAAQELK